MEKNGSGTHKGQYILRIFTVFLLLAAALFAGLSTILIVSRAEYIGLEKFHAELNDHLKRIRNLSASRMNAAAQAAESGSRDITVIFERNARLVAVECVLFLQSNLSDGELGRIRDLAVVNERMTAFERRVITENLNKPAAQKTRLNSPDYVILRNDFRGQLAQIEENIGELIQADAARVALGDIPLIALSGIMLVVLFAAWAVAYRFVSRRLAAADQASRALTEEVEGHRKTTGRLTHALEEKSILISEMHHRVKNNLQIISSLLKLQKQRITDKAAIEEFEIAILRIRSIAVVHESLYVSEDLTRSNITKNMKRMVSNLIEAYAFNASPIRMLVDVEDLDLDLSRSITCSLIINELLLNAVKHAFGKPRQGVDEIEIKVRSIGELFVLVVSDNGASSAEFENQKTLGMKIVQTLVKQLDGDMDVDCGNGTRVTVRFPKVKMQDAKPLSG